MHRGMHTLAMTIGVGALAVVVFALLLWVR